MGSTECGVDETNSKLLWREGGAQWSRHFCVGVTDDCTPLVAGQRGWWFHVVGGGLRHCRSDLYSDYGRAKFAGAKGKYSLESTKLPLRLLYVKTLK